MDSEGNKTGKDQECDNEKSKTKKSKCLRSLWVWIRRTTNATDWLIVLFTLALAVTGVFQYTILNEQWRTLEKTDMTSRLRDRAFINFSDPIIRHFPQYKPPRLTINVVAQNTGNVPARDVSVNYDCVIFDRPKNIVDPFQNAIFSPARIPKFIGPQQSIGFVVRDDTQDFFDRIMKEEIMVFIVIKAEYRDGFDPHNTRTTQMSRQLRVDASRLHSFSFAESHNCIDEDCK